MMIREGVVAGGGSLEKGSKGNVSDGLKTVFIGNCHEGSNSVGTHASDRRKLLHVGKSLLLQPPTRTSPSPRCFGKFLYNPVPL